MILLSSVCGGLTPGTTAGSRARRGTCGGTANRGSGAVIIGRTGLRACRTVRGVHTGRNRGTRSRGCGSPLSRGVARRSGSGGSGTTRSG